MSRRHSKVRQTLLLVAMFAVSTAALTQDTHAVVAVYVDGGKAGVIAFMPPALRNSNDEAATAARAQVRLAIAKTSHCLADDTVSYHVVFVDRIAVRWPGREETFQVSQFAPLVGALLVRPGTNPHIVFAGAGPDALARLLPSAASDYFGIRCMGG